MKMKAAVVREYGKPMSIEEVELAPPKEKEVLVRTVYTGFCHSDWSGIAGHLVFPLPYVPGHEAAGVVEAVGPGVTSVKPGDHVVATWMITCGQCPQCTSGRGYICSTSHDIHTSGTLWDRTSRLTDKSGKTLYHQTFVSGFAEYMVLPEQGAVKIPKEFPLDEACFIGCCMPTGFGAVTNVAQVKPGDSVAIWGLGGVGLNVVQGAKLRGAYPIIGVDIEANREEIARQCGVTHFIDNSKDDPVPIIMELTRGGVDYAFEVVGDAGAVTQAYWTLAIGGRYIQIGAAIEPASIIVGFAALHNKWILGTMYGNVGTHHDLPKFVDMVARGDYNLKRLITKKFGLQEINDVFDAMARRKIIGRWLCAFEQ
jgi:S-(hydroxymethyl)glutathione dehydrogenase/alcohol dehydrogenase